MTGRTVVADPGTRLRDIAVSVFAITMPALQRREGWIRLGTDNPNRWRERYLEPVGR
ncbi:hypothetical protein ACFYXC_36600 [Streptomyces sp. NPDC002701]|uniref:hypothetical protein n=1 Tax=Streptomyces sp. NPDC002701 TaxID=3364661 RepID=UPI0036B22F85